MSKLSRRRKKQILQDSGDDFKEDVSSQDNYTNKTSEVNVYKDMINHTYV